MSKPKPRHSPGHGHDHDPGHGHAHRHDDDPGHGHDPENVRDHWEDEETVQWYLDNYGEHETNRMTVAAAKLRPDDVVVDIGCGGGAAVREAAACTRARVIGVDPSSLMLRACREHNAVHPAAARIEFCQGHAGDLPLRDGSVTVALAINSMHHWDDPRGDLSEVLRVLAPGGRLFVTEEIVDGKSGHGEGELADPEAIVDALTGAGLLDVRLDRTEEGNVAMFLISGRKP